VKKITKENWLKPDFASTIWVCKKKGDTDWHGITNEDRIEEISECSLSEKAPLEMRKLFEVAKALLVYGFLFYPFYNLAFEQLSRLIEEVVSSICKRERFSRNKLKELSFSEKINWLIQSGLIDEKHKGRWMFFWSIRNKACHLKKQRIVPPSMAIDIFHKITDDLNALIDSQ